MSHEIRNFKKDENAMRIATHKMQLKAVDAAPRRPALGELGNKVRNADQTSKKTEPEKKASVILTKSLKEVKPRVDTWRNDVVQQLKKPAQLATGELSSAQVPIAKPRLVRAKTLQTAKPQEALRIQFAAAKTSSIVGKSADNVSANVKVKVIKRQESNLTRRSLTKVREALKQERKPSKNESEDDDRSSTNSVLSEVADITNKQQLSHSTILLADVENIDVKDEANQMLVSEYVNDIYSYMYNLEKQFPVNQDYLSTQIEVSPKMRTVLIDWINEVHLQFRLVPETFYMTVAIVDRYLQAVKTTSRANLQLVGVTALFLASKYEELFPPEIKDFVYITDDTYTKKQILDMERHICKKLEFQLGRPLPIHFLRRFSKAAHATDTTHMMAKYFIELSCISYPMSHYRPSEIAAAALLLSLRVLEGANAPVWTNTLHFYTTYSEADLRPILLKLAEIVQDAPTNKIKAVFTKYRMPKFSQVAVRSELDEKNVKELIIKMSETERNAHSVVKP